LVQRARRGAIRRGVKRMTVVTASLSVQSEGHCDMLDLTSQVARSVAESGLGCGTVTVFVAGSTAGVTTIEYEPNLVLDFKSMWERTAPQDIPYEHNRTWGDGNGHSHVRASLLGASLTVPFCDGRLLLGTWQQVVLVDFDNRARSRTVVLQIMGE